MLPVTEEPYAGAHSLWPHAFGRATSLVLGKRKFLVGSIAAILDWLGVSDSSIFLPALEGKFDCGATFAASLPRHVACISYPRRWWRGHQLPSPGKYRTTVIARALKKLAVEAVGRELAVLRHHMLTKLHSQLLLLCP